MKALLAEDQRGEKNRYLIVLLPSGKTNPDAGDPANVAIELDGDNLRAWIILAWEMDSLQLVKEVEIDGRLLLRALEYMHAKIEYGRQEVELKDFLFSTMIDPNCDAMSFLNLGPIIF